MSLRTITPEQARSMLEAGAVLVDIREPDEYAREHIPQACLAPLGRIESALPVQAAGPIIFHCRTGARTRANEDRLAAAATCDACILEGGMDAWKRAGLPVLTDRKQPIEIMRQVQITAGSLVLLGVVLGVTVSAAFYALAALIGAGLMFSGITGTCAMARALSRMPWNRRKAQAG